MKTTTFFLFCLFLAVFVQPAHAEQWEELDKSFDRQYAGKNFDKALIVAQEVLKSAEKAFALDSKEYRKSLQNLARVYKAQEMWDKSLEFYNELIKLEISRIAKIDSSMSTALKSIVTIYHHLNDKKSAAEVYDRATVRLSQVTAVDHSIYIELADYYTSKVMAQSNLNTQPLSPDISKYGQTNQSAVAENNLSALKTRCAEHKKYARIPAGKEDCQKLYDLMQKKGENNSIDFARVCMNLGYFYMLSTKYAKSGEFYSEAITIWERNNFPQDIDYADALYFSSITLQIDKQYRKARDLLLKAERIAVTQDHSQYYMYSPIIILLANMQRIIGDNTGAEKSYNKYRDFLHATKDTNPSAWMAYYMGIGPVYESQKKWIKSDKIYLLYNKASRDLINDLLELVTISSEKQVAQNFMWFNYNLNFYYSYCMKRKEETPELLGEMYNDELVHKGLILRTLRRKVHRILNSGDRELINNFENWLNLRQKLAKLYLLTVSDRKVSVLNLEREAEALENKINSTLYTYKEKDDLKLDWKDVQKKLKSNEAAIEFISFENFDVANKIWSGKTNYGALIVRPGYEQPVYVHLFQEHEFQKFLDDNREANPFDQVRKLYTWLPGKYDGYFKGDTLYNFTWQPLEDYLHGVDKIYYSLTGLLHKISFAAIPFAEEKSLINKYELQLLSTTSLLLDDKKKPFKLDKKYKILLYGGIFYDLDPASAKNSAAKYRDDNESFFIRDRSFTLSRSKAKGSAWPYLEGSLAEVQQINSLFDVNRIKAEARIGAQALEESFKKMDKKRPEIIHIATHGFFSPEKKEIKTDRMMSINAKNQIDPDDSFKRSGLLFAGANHTWLGKYMPDGLEDGVLTAYEVSKLNLIHTKLVVLSACETGLGDISGGEGVYGLQRAFKLAGVDNIIMSLWQIPDEQTVELMNSFYDLWLGGMSLQEAFHTAQKTMTEKYEPYFWGAFVLLE